MFDLPILLIIILLPLLGSVAIMLFTNYLPVKKQEISAIYIAILTSLLTLGSTIYLLLKFDISVTSFQFVEKYSWLPIIGLDLHFGVDGFSIFFLILTALLTLICVLTSLFLKEKNIKLYLCCFLLLEAFCLGAFLAINLLLFYIFFEIILIPIYFIIGLWGGKQRTYAALKFFLYTFFGSVFFLISLIFIFVQFGSFEFAYLTTKMQILPLNTQNYLWLAIFFAFAIKIPIVPLHSWLPDAHVQAPTAGSIMLAGILLKLGGYGFLRVSLPLLPGASEYFSPYVITLGTFAVIYGSFVALAQTNMKKMIAYSSIAHMGYVTAGVFSLNLSGFSGAVFQMLSHGLISASLFLIIGILTQRHHTKEISKYGGVISSMPVLSLFFMITMLGSIGLPGLSGFIGEFLSIIGIAEANLAKGIICAFGIVMGAIYMLKLYRDLMLGEIEDSSIADFSDLKKYEILTFLPLVTLIIYLGIMPNKVLQIIDLPVRSLAAIYDTL